MHPFFIYLIQVNLALSLFYLLYAIVLKRDTFFWLRRLFFLTVILFSLLYPFFAIPALNDLWAFHSSNTEEAPATVFIGEPGVAKLAVEETLSVYSTSIRWESVIYLLYFAITGIFVFRFVFQCLSIWRIRAKSGKRLVSGISVYQLKEDIPPFSFFNMIFIHIGKHSDAELSQILLHEQMHVRERHSIDIMLSELLCLTSWWNPFVWLMKREMAINLEYLADHGVLREGTDCQEYQYHLLRLTYHESDFRLVNNFNVSQIKQRIMMMNKTKSPSLIVVKYFLIVPLFFMLVTANSIYAAQTEDNQVTGEVVDDNLQVSKQFPIEQDDLFAPSSRPLNAVLSTTLTEIEENNITTAKDGQPQYPGGKSAMMKYLADNVKYPYLAQESGFQGRVVCTFTITKDGSIDDVKVIRNVDPTLDAEVIRIIKMMPKWEPATKQGKTVDVPAMIPVVFRLQGDNPQDDLLTKEEKEALFDKNKPTQAEIKDGTLIIDEVVVLAYSNKKSPALQSVAQEKSEAESAYLKYLADHLRYPVTAQKNGIVGMVKAVYSVNEKGEVSNIRIAQDTDPTLGTEVKRVIESLPNHIVLNKVGGKANPDVDVSVNFRLQNEEGSSAVSGDCDIVVTGYEIKKNG